MTKTLTEQWREGTLPEDTYYWKVCKENRIADKYEMYDYTKVCDVNKIECLAPVPSYRQLYGPNDGNIPVGLFTVLEIIKRDIEQYQKIRPLTDLECGIKSQVVSLLKKQEV